MNQLGPHASRRSARSFCFSSRRCSFSALRRIRSALLSLYQVYSTAMGCSSTCINYSRVDLLQYGLHPTMYAIHSVVYLHQLELVAGLRFELGGWTRIRLSWFLAQVPDLGQEQRTHMWWGLICCSWCDLTQLNRKRFHGCFGLGAIFVLHNDIIVQRRQNDSIRYLVFIPQSQSLCNAQTLNLSKNILSL